MLSVFITLVHALIIWMLNLFSLLSDSFGSFSFLYYVIIYGCKTMAPWLWAVAQVREVPGPILLLMTTKIFMLCNLHLLHLMCWIGTIAMRIWHWKSHQKIQPHWNNTKTTLKSFTKDTVKSVCSCYSRMLR